jgi:hypothetical protein
MLFLSATTTSATPLEPGKADEMFYPHMDVHDRHGLGETGFVYAVHGGRPLTRFMTQQSTTILMTKCMARSMTPRRIPTV